MKTNDEIRNANRKALPKFLLIVLCGGLAGGVIGYSAASNGIDMLADNIRQAGGYFGMNIAPWLLVAAAVITLIVCVPMYHKAAVKLKDWDGEDEQVSDFIEKRVSYIIWITTAALILAFFLITASYSGGPLMFEEKRTVVMYIVSIAAFVAIIVEVLVLQQKCVDITKKMNPEKTASIYDMKFRKKWVDSCDEAEKIMMGKCAFKAYTATNISCAVLAAVFAVSSLLFSAGLMASFAVCLVWIINQSVYCRESLKSSKTGSIL